MLRISVIAAGIALAASASSGAFQPDVKPDHKYLSALFFPESKNWKAFDELPVYDIRKPELAAKLRPALSRLTAAMGGECPLESKLLDNADVRKFSVIDVRGDGDQDIVYSGPAFCAEGNATSSGTVRAGN